MPTSGTNDAALAIQARRVAVEFFRSQNERRYDDLKSDRVKPIDGEEAFQRLREKSDNRRG